MPWTEKLMKFLGCTFFKTHSWKYYLKRSRSKRGIRVYYKQCSHCKLISILVYR